jgi:uncharacterized membrane protein HdeD (DUF308 family)
VEQKQSDPSEMLREVGRSWGWVLAFGILTLIAGLIAMAHPGQVLVVIPIVIGIELIFAGIFRLVLAFSEEAEGHRALLSVIGLLSILFGIFLFRHAFQTVIWMTLLIGAIWVVAGIVDLFGGLFNKDAPNRGMSIFMGILGTIAGIVLLTEPNLSATALAWIIGVWLTVYGVLLIVSAFRVKSLSQ